MYTMARLLRENPLMHDMCHVVLMSDARADVGAASDRNASPR